MRKRIVLLILSAGLCAGVLINTATQMSNYVALNKQYTEDLKILKKEQSHLLNMIAVKQEELEANGRGFLLDDVKVGETLAAVKGAELVSIKAFSLIDGTASELLSTEDVSDVAFFKDSIQVIQYNFDITDSAKFFKSLGSTIFFTDSVYIRLDEGTAQLNVIPCDYAGQESMVNMNVLANAKATFLNTEERDNLGGELDLD